MKSIIMMLIASMCLLAGAAEHPHLLFNAQELPGLREKIKSGVPRRAWYALQKRCEAHLKLKILSPGSDLDDQKDPLTELLMAWHLSENTAYRDKFLELLTGADWGKLKYDIALIFDMGYPIMPEKQRGELKKLLIERKNKAGNPLATNFYAFSNWGLIPGMRGVRENAALFGHPEYDPEISVRAALLIQQVFSNWIDDKGAVLEGGAYLNYPMQRIGGTDCFILKRMGYDLVSGTNLGKLPYFLMTTAMPDGSVPALGDSSAGQRISQFALQVLLFLDLENPAMNLLAEKGVPENAPNAINGIFIYRKPAGSSSVQVPLADCYPQNGITSYKNSWEKDAFYSITQARYHRGHAHEDVGSFLLSANGEDWIVDPGYGESLATMHSMVVINGAGPKYNGGAGVVQAQFAMPSFAAMSTDLSRFWNQTLPGNVGDPIGLAAFPVATASRHWAVIGKTAEFKVPPYLVIADSIRRDDQSRNYTFFLQFGKDKNIELEKDAVAVTGKSGKLQVNFIVPRLLELEKEKYVTEGRFANREFQRIKAGQRRVGGSFCTVLYPHTAQMPPLRQEAGTDGFSAKLIWPDAVDYIDLDTGNLNNKNWFKLLRISADASLSDKLPEKVHYMMLGGDDWNVAKQSLIKVDVLAGSMARDRLVVTSAAFDGEMLVLDTHTHQRASWQVPLLTRVTAYAPGVRTVICNGKEQEFSRDGHYVTVSAHSRVVKTATQLRENAYLKWLQIVEQNVEKQQTMKEK